MALGCAPDICFSFPSALCHFPTSGFFTKNSVCSKISWREDVCYIYIEKESLKEKRLIIKIIIHI